MASATTVVACTLSAAACRMLCCLEGTCSQAVMTSPAESLPNMPSIAVSWGSDRSRPVTLVIQSVEAAGAGFRAQAAARIDRYAFGVTAAKGMAGPGTWISA